MGLLGRDEILTHTDLPFEDVYVPEWSGSVRVRGLSGKDRDAYEASTVIMRTGKGGRLEQGRDLDNLRAKLIVRCLVDDNGDRLFHDGEYDTVGALSGAILARLWDTASKLSGLGDEDLEELVRDFGSTPGGGSSTPSPSPSGAPSPNSSPGSPPGS
jgi:hypothetical protein